MNNEINHNNGSIPISLFHGTSTIFLNSIINHGLAGNNFFKEWKIMALAVEVFALSKQHLKETELFQWHGSVFEQMSLQLNAGINYQHGNTYLSASKKHAKDYANRIQPVSSFPFQYGSEILNWTIAFLMELINFDRKCQYITPNFKEKYSEIFKLIYVRNLPLLIEVKNVSFNSLVNELGNEIDSLAVIERINYCLKQTNPEFCFNDGLDFRLTKPVPKEYLIFWIIIENKLYEIKP